MFKVILGTVLNNTVKMSSTFHSVTSLSVEIVSEKSCFMKKNFSKSKVASWLNEFQKGNFDIYMYTDHLKILLISQTSEIAASLTNLKKN